MLVLKRTSTTNAFQLFFKFLKLDKLNKFLKYVCVMSEKQLNFIMNSNNKLFILIILNL